MSSLDKKKKIIIAVIASILLIAIVLSIVLPLTIGRKGVDSFVYSYEHRTKIDNFNLVNTTAKHGQVVLVGDSIVELHEVNDYFKDFTDTTGKWVYNRGISGDHAEGLKTRIESNVLSIQPSHMVMLIGTNDLGRGTANATIANDIKISLELTQRISPETKIMLLAVYPVNKDISPRMVGRRANKDILQLNVLLKAVAQEMNVEWLDLTADLADDDGNFRDDYTYDGLHPKAKGYLKITERILPFLNS